MSPPHAYTVGVAVSPLSADDEDDNDICPVCDGECTCDNRPRSSISPIQGYAPRVSSHRASTVSTQTAQSVQPTLKIRLTVPPSMLGKRRTVEHIKKKSKTTGGPSTSLPIQDVEMTVHPQPGHKTTYNPQSVQGVIVAKRRGRPPKSAPPKLIISPRIKGDVAPTFSAPSASFSQSPSRRKNTRQTYQKPPQPRRSSASGLLSKAKASPIPRKSRRQLNDGSESDLTDIASADEDDDEPRFPTFVSASDSSSSESSDCESSSSLASESSIEAEEEEYLISRERHAHKARVRRDFLGDEGHAKRRDARDSWIIRPRKKSVGPSDVEMDGDSDSVSQGDDDDDDDGDDQEDEAETDGVRYVGVATGWSEDEESNFDADLFFANLSDSTAESSQAEDADDDTEDVPNAESAPTPLSAHDVTKQELDNLLFEVTEAWDGKVVFANSVRHGQGILDIDFEVSTAQLIIEASPATTPSADPDVQMTDGEDKEYEDDDGGDNCDLDLSDGDTTEEELVGNSGLPTERAIHMFRFPSNVPAIDPRSTLSPVASPVTRAHRRVKSQVTSPKPSDILAGKISWPDSEDRARGLRNARGSRSLSLRGHRPVMGQFDAIASCPSKRAIIDHFSKDVPSPFRRHRRGRGGSRVGSTSRTSRSSSFAESSRSSLHLLSPDELISPMSFDLPSAESIDLNDVLDISFFDSDPSDNQSSSNVSTEVDSKKHLKNLNRWDVISVGTFRQTVETNGGSEIASGRWSSEPASSSKGHTYGHGMKEPSLETMLYNKSSTSPTQSLDVPGSPIMPPVRDGNRTPTNLAQTRTIQESPIPQHKPRKKHKEVRKEKKKPLKTSAPVAQKHQHYQHRHHPHYPNTKMRGSNSMQRSNFFGSPGSSVPSLNS